MEKLVKLRTDLISVITDLISVINNWQQVRARSDTVEIDALLDITMKALLLAKKLAESSDGK